MALLSACGSGNHDAPAASGSAARSSTSGTASASSTTTATTTTALPGTGKPTVTIGDKNFTEQFLLGELYGEALKAQGFSIVLNRNIGPTDVTIQALQSGRLDMYPEYLETWNEAVAGYDRPFRTKAAAYRAAQRYAADHGMELLTPTPFSDTAAIGLTNAYAEEHGLRSLSDLRTVAPTMTIGAPAQFEQSASGLPAIEQAYGFYPAAVKQLDIGSQYPALDRGTVQAAVVNTTDGALSGGGYTLLRDPLRIFGWGNVVPVLSDKAIIAEGPAFIETIEQVSRLLTTPVMRELNAAVDISHRDPAVVAKQFLLAHGIPAQTA